jgi:hypothetical protein
MINLILRFASPRLISSRLSLSPRRFYDPREGEILLDGRQLPTLKLKDVRREIGRRLGQFIFLISSDTGAGLVAQNTELFAGSIEENISYGMPPGSFTRFVLCPPLHPEESTAKTSSLQLARPAPTTSSAKCRRDTRPALGSAVCASPGDRNNELQSLESSFVNQRSSSWTRSVRPSRLHSTCPLPSPPAGHFSTRCRERSEGPSLPKLVLLIQSPPPR